MRYQLVFQDPSSDDPAYLYEGIIRELDAADVARFEGIFAFASRQGVASLLEDPDFDKFLARGGSCFLVVGLDAITDLRTLDLLDSLSERYAELEVAVFHNDVSDLFHPKVSRFIRDDGAVTVLAGSGNLTPGGLRRNIEAYSIARLAVEDLGTNADLDAWGEFLARHASRIRPIDDDARSAARKNRFVGRRRLPDVEPEVEPAESGPETEEVVEGLSVLKPTQRVLLAPVQGGGRWNQVHFNIPVTTDFFHLTPGEIQRVFLYQVHVDGTLGDVESRPLVYSQSNANRKIEFHAHSGEPYPVDGRPLLVVREIGTRMHRYVMLFPGDPGYDELDALNESQPAVGPGLHRSIVTAAQVLRAWPACPV